MTCPQESLSACDIGLGEHGVDLYSFMSTAECVSMVGREAEPGGTEITLTL